MNNLLTQTLILSFLSKKPSYGYRLRENIKKIIGEQLSQGDFYKLLQDLEKYGYTSSKWMFHKIPLKSAKLKKSIRKPIRVYSITPDGLRLLQNNRALLSRVGKV